MTLSEFFAQERVSDVTRDGTEVSPRKAQDIARAEMARRRRKLGKLTPEQEKNIETLLISTANKVSKMIAAIQLLSTPDQPFPSKFQSLREAKK